MILEYLVTFYWESSGREMGTAMTKCKYKEFCPLHQHSPGKYFHRDDTALGIIHLSTLFTALVVFVPLIMRHYDRNEQPEYGGCTCNEKKFIS